MATQTARVRFLGNNGWHTYIGGQIADIPLAVALQMEMDGKVEVLERPQPEPAAKPVAAETKDVEASPADRMIHDSPRRRGGRTKPWQS